MAKFLLVLTGILLLLGGPALAHKLSLFASAAGPEIEGKAYFKGGHGARGIAIRILGPDGGLLGEAETDAEGRFRFTATHRIDHVITADVGDGHQTEFTVRAAELPDSLPAADGSAPTPTTAPVPTADPAAAAPDGKTPDLTRRVEAAVARQIRPMREQVAALEDQIRLRDIIGGIGYIVGIAGLMAWLGARRKGRNG